jgi:hypothetical protein
MLHVGKCLENSFTAFSEASIRQAAPSLIPEELPAVTVPSFVNAGFSDESFSIEVLRNKVAPPFRQAEFDIMYGKGISKTGEIVDMAVELNVVQKSGSWFSYDGDKLGQGRDSVVQLLRDNAELADEIEKKIKDKVMLALHPLPVEKEEE